MTNPITHAANIASILHLGQTRKYTGRPYIEHPARVAGRLTRLGCREEMICAAWLHDTLEDCDVSFDKLHSAYAIPLDVCLLVHLMTNPSKKYSNLNRAERKKMDLAHLKNTPREVRMIKLADRTDNLRELDPTQPFAVQYMNESLALLAELSNTNEELEIDLVEEIKRLDNAVCLAKTPPPVSATSADLAAILNEKLGGGPEMLFDNNPDHYSIVTSMLPFMKIAGPAWKAVADRVEAHQKAKVAAKTG